MSELHSVKLGNPNTRLLSTIVNDANKDRISATDSDANIHVQASLKAHDKLIIDSTAPPVVGDKSKANSPIGTFTESFTSSIHNMAFAGVQVAREATGNKELLKDFRPAQMSHEANIGSGNWLAQQLGSGVAFAIPMAATAFLTRGRSLGAESSAAFNGMKAAAASGAITGFAFTPTLDNKGEAATGGAFWQKKALQTGSMSAAFATMAGVDKMHIGGHIGKAILPGSTAGIAAIGGRIAQRGLDGAMAGYSGGFVDTSIQSGFKADLKTLNESGIKWAAAGALFSGAGEGLKRSNFTGGKGKLAEAGNAAANLHEPLVKGPETPALAHVGISPDVLASRRTSGSPAGQHGRAFSGGEGYGSRPEIVTSRGPGRQPQFRQDAPTSRTGREMGSNVVKGDREVSSEKGTGAKGERREINSGKPPEWMIQNEGARGKTKPAADRPAEADKGTMGGAKGSGGFGSEKAATRSMSKTTADTASAREVTKSAPVAVPLAEKPVLKPAAVAPEAKATAVVKTGEPETSITIQEPKAKPEIAKPEPKALAGVSNFGDLPAAKAAIDKVASTVEVPATPVAKQNAGLEPLRTQPTGKALESTVHVAEITEIITPVKPNIEPRKASGSRFDGDPPVSGMTIDVKAETIGTPTAGAPKLRAITVGKPIVEAATTNKPGSGNPEMPSLPGSTISLERPFANLLEGSMFSPKQIGTQLRQTASESIGQARQVIHQTGEAINAAKVNIADSVSGGTKAVRTQAQTDRALLVEAALPKWREGSLGLAQAGRKTLDSTGKTVENVTTFKANEIQALPGALEARKGNWDVRASEIAEAANARIAGVRDGANTFTSDWRQRARNTRANLAEIEVGAKEGGSAAMTNWEGRVKRGLKVDKGVRELLGVPEGTKWSRTVDNGMIGDQAARNYVTDKGTEAINFTSKAVKILSEQDLKLRRTVVNAANSVLDGAETFVTKGPERHNLATGRLVEFVKAGAERDAAARAKVAGWFGEKLSTLREGVTAGTKRDGQLRNQLEATANELRRQSNGERPVSDHVSQKVTNIKEGATPVVAETAAKLQNGLMASIERARQAWSEHKNPKVATSLTSEAKVLALAPSEAVIIPDAIAKGTPRELASMAAGKAGREMSSPIAAFLQDQRIIGEFKEQFQQKERVVLPESKQVQRAQEPIALAAEAMPLRVVELRKLFSENGIPQSEGGKTKNKATMLSDLKERIESGTALTDGGKPISAARTAQILEAANKV